MIKQLSSELENFQSRAAAAQSAEELLKHANIYSRGYAFFPNAHPLNFPEYWRHVKLGNRTLASDPALSLNISTVPGLSKTVVLLGDAFDSRMGLDESSSVADYLCQIPLNGKFFEEVEKKSLALGGRFVVIAIDADDFSVFMDPMASLACFYTSISEDVVLASHSALVASVRPESTSEEERWVMRHPDYVSPGGKYLPAMVTAHDDCYQVHGNCALHVRSGLASHRRIYPTRELSELSVGEATEIFVDELRFQLGAWIKNSQGIGLALTAGRDSRSILFSGLDQLKDAQAFAITYHFFESDNKSTRKDLQRANDLALSAGLPHKIVALESAINSKGMARLYNGTFPVYARFPGLAQSFYQQLPARASIIFGIGGGIGTAFFQRRDENAITPELLAKKFTVSAFREDSRLIDSFASYIDHTQFTEESIANFDFYDLFHWEHRLTKWAALGYAEYDLSVVPALPMNSRRLIEAMLSLPYEDRLNKKIYDSIDKWGGMGN